jgi:hypothetical protein
MQRFSAVLKREKPRVLSHSLLALKSAHALTDGSCLPMVKGVLGVAVLLVEAAEVRTHHTIIPSHSQFSSESRNGWYKLPTNGGSCCRKRPCYVRGPE